MAGPLIADVGYGLQMRIIVMNILNKQTQTAENGQLSNLQIKPGGLTTECK
jgi:hypothetical protein